MNCGNQDLQMPRFVPALHCSRDCPTLLMPKDHNQFCPKVMYCIFDASQFVVSSDVSRNSNDKQIAQSLIKDQFGRDSRIRTTQNHGKRMLTALQLFTAFQTLVGM